MCPISRRAAAVLLGAAALLVACGSGGGEAQRPAVVRGTLTQAQAFTVGGNVSLALDWQSALYAGFTVNAALGNTLDDPSYVTTCEVIDPIVDGTCDGVPQAGHQLCHTQYVLADTLLRPVEYEAKFPIAFELELEARPPPEALYDLAQQGGRGSYAMGVVLGFVDEDQDGKLRLGSPGVASEPGLGHSAFQLYTPPDGVPRRSYFVTYLDGEFDPANVPSFYAEVVNALPQGYAIWFKEEWVDAWGRRIAVRRSAKPIDTPIELVTEPGVLEDAIWCEAFDGDLQHVPEIPAGEVPVSCWAGGLGASWWRSTPTGACTYYEESYWAEFTCGGEAPAWNCPGG